MKYSRTVSARQVKNQTHLVDKSSLYSPENVTSQKDEKHRNDCYLAEYLMKPFHINVQIYAKVRYFLPLQRVGLLRTYKIIWFVYGGGRKS